MSVSKVGLDLNALQGMEAPTITLNTTADGLINQIIEGATTTTQGYFPYVVLVGIFIITFWYLSDKNPQADFKYSDLRALTLAFAITSSIGLTQIMVGFTQSWMAVVFMLLATVLTTVILIIVENKQ